MLWLFEAEVGALFWATLLGRQNVDLVFESYPEYLLSGCGEARASEHVHQWYHFHENAPRYCECGEYEGGVAVRRRLPYPFYI